MNAPQSDRPGDALLARLRHVLESLEEPHGALLPRSLRPGGGQPPTSFPVLTQLPQLAQGAPHACHAAIEALQDAAPSLHWRQTYGRDNPNDDFLDNYAWVELIGKAGLYHDSSTSIGLLLLGAHTHYPEHFHPATELYIPLSGKAEWYDEDAGWRQVTPLTPILHRTMIRHAMRTGDEPLLAFFQWSGPDITSHARMAVNGA